MTYILFHTQSTQQIRCYHTLANARRGMRTSNRNAGWTRITRVTNNGSELEWCVPTTDTDAEGGFGPYAIATVENYSQHVVYDRTVVNLVSGQEVTIRSNTPLCCDPSSGTYWSM